MARNYWVQKRRRKKIKGKEKKFVLVPPSREIQRGNWRIFHDTSVPRVTARARSDTKCILRERKRGRIRLEVAQPGVIEAIREPIISLSPRLKRVNSSILLTIRLLLPPPILNTRYYIAFLAIDRSKKPRLWPPPLPARSPPWKAGIKYSITIKRRSSINPLSTRVWKKCFHLDGSGHGRSRRVYETPPI